MFSMIGRRIKHTGKTARKISIKGAHSFKRGSELSVSAMKRLRDARADMRWRLRQMKQAKLEHRISEAQYEEQLSEMESKLAQLELTAEQNKYAARTTRMARRSVKTAGRDKDGNPISKGLRWLDQSLPARSRKRRHRARVESM